MSTQAQIDANRANAQKSTGPVSIEGKSASSRNRLKSGIYAKSAIIRGENPAELDKLAAEYYDTYAPADPQERTQVDIMIRAEWQLRRLAVVEAEVWEYKFSFRDLCRDTSTPLGYAYCGNDAMFYRLQRQIASVQRCYREAAKELKALQSSRGTGPRPVLAAKPLPTEPIGFESSNSGVKPLPGSEIGFESPIEKKTQIGFESSKSPANRPDPLSRSLSGTQPAVEPSHSNVAS